MDLSIVYFLAVLGFVRCNLVNLKCNGIKTLTNEHNAKRLELAQGKVPGQPAAANMNLLVWDDELAAKAAKWASRNKYAHNPDRTIPSRRFGTGENIYYYGTSDRSVKEIDMKWPVEAWFSEHKDFHFKKLEESDFASGHPAIGHYTQLAWWNSIYIGCGVSQYQTKEWNNFLVVCNYGPTGNYLGQEPYQSGNAKKNLSCGAKDCSRLYGDSC